MRSYLINEQQLYDKIYSQFMEISTSYEEDENDDYDKKKEKEKGKRNAISIWKAGEYMKLMELLKLFKDRNNKSIVTHAIIFILSVDMEEELGGINASHLNNSAQKEFKNILQGEFLENLPN